MLSLKHETCEVYLVIMGILWKFFDYALGFLVRFYEAAMVTDIATVSDVTLKKTTTKTL